MVPATRFAPLSDLPVLFWGDPDVRGGWVPLFEDVPLLIPFLPSLILRRDLVRNSRECGFVDKNKRASLESEFALLQPIFANVSENYTLRALCDARDKASSARWLLFSGGQTSIMVPVCHSLYTTTI